MHGSPAPSDTASGTVKAAPRSVRGERVCATVANTVSEVSALSLPRCTVFIAEPLFHRDFHVRQERCTFKEGGSLPAQRTESLLRGSEEILEVFITPMFISSRIGVVLSQTPVS